MALHVRYGDYELRKSEILHVAKRLVNKVPAIKVETVTTAHKFGYNMGQMGHGNNLLRTYRYHPDPKSWRTELALESDGRTMAVLPPEKYTKHSLEDGRLFLYQGKPHLSMTISRSRVSGQACDPCVTGFGRLDKTELGWVLANWIEPKYAKNDWTWTEKNWVFFENDGKLYFTHQTSPNHVVCEMGAGATVTKSYKSICPPCAFGEPRGGTQMFPYEGGLLRFVHTQQVNKKSDLYWTYHLAALVMENKPPFRIIRISKHPIISGNELYTPDCSHWKPRVTIPYGAIEKNGGWEVSCGLNDCASGTVSLTADQLNL